MLIVSNESSLVNNRKRANNLIKKDFFFYSFLNTKQQQQKRLFFSRMGIFMFMKMYEERDIESIGEWALPTKPMREIFSFSHENSLIFRHWKNHMFFIFIHKPFIFFVNFINDVINFQNGSFSLTNPIAIFLFFHTTRGSLRYFSLSIHTHSELSVSLSFIQFRILFSRQKTVRASKCGNNISHHNFFFLS